VLSSDVGAPKTPPRQSTANYPFLNDMAPHPPFSKCSSTRTSLEIVNPTFNFICFNGDGSHDSALKVITRQNVGAPSCMARTAAIPTSNGCSIRNLAQHAIRRRNRRSHSLCFETTGQWRNGVGQLGNRNWSAEFPSTELLRSFHRHATGKIIQFCLLFIFDT
jgi:hypothetical protein